MGGLVPMAFFLQSDIGDAATTDHLDALKKAWDDYARYIESIRDRLPASAFEFATATWRNPEDHRSLHDSWVESLVVNEIATGERNSERTTEILVRLLGPYHDGFTTLRYRDVVAFSIDSPHSERGHGDWLCDEVRLSERGLVFHEVDWRSRSRG
jgi:hypothetical protein